MASKRLYAGYPKQIRPNDRVPLLATRTNLIDVAKAYSNQNRWTDMLEKHLKNVSKSPKEVVEVFICTGFENKEILSKSHRPVIFLINKTPYSTSFLDSGPAHSELAYYLNPLMCLKQRVLFSNSFLKACDEGFVGYLHDRRKPYLANNELQWRALVDLMCYLW